MIGTYIYKFREIINIYEIDENKHNMDYIFNSYGTLYCTH